MILPFVRDLLADLEHTASFEQAQRHLSLSRGRRRVSGLTSTARSLYIPLLARAAKVPVVLLVADNKAADAMHLALRAGCELTGAIAAERVLKLPAHDVLPFENMSPHPEVQEQRATTLWKIATGDAAIVIAPVEAAAMKLFPAPFYGGLAQVLRRGEEIDVDMLLTHLASVGYEQVDVVEMPGQYTRRGGILDVYSPEADRPVRMEFFGDEIETMRKFDPESQRSQSPLDEARLLPLTETPVTERLLAAVHARLSGARFETNDEGEMVAEMVAAGGVSVFPGWEFFAGVAGANKTLLDLFPRCVLFVEEPGMIKNQVERWWNKVEQRHDRSSIGTLIRPEDIYLRPELLEAQRKSHPGLDIDQLGAVDVLEDDETLGEIAFSSRPTLRFHGSIPAFVEQIKNLMQQETRMLLAAPNQGEVERLATLLREYELPYRLGSRVMHTGSETMYDEASHLGGDLRTPIILRAPIATGVSLPDANLVVFGANDLNDEADVTARPAARKSKTAAFISDFRDLAVGDYVVHVEHGIARYLGLKEIAQDGTTLEFMILEFAEEAKLYVPLTRLDLIQKYRSTESGPAPVLHRLGTQQWAKTKARVKKAMQDMADELLKLYAQRKAAQGHAYSADNEFQREFEDSFDYNETDDQLSAIADIKRDMESTTPMDRLLCGDVGYGKTEVAMRAAFKAVQDGKQVAVLTPTTVLSFQHYETFKKRFRQFPIHIEMLSRFRTAKEQKLIVERVEAGEIDILIGTHRLLSKDLKFHDIGLLIVDEEQRFGVRHKERLKQLRAQLDVLTMSATPIPRTLHMSLVGLRDMSVIETPPKDRMAIQTIVAKFDEKLVRSAVEVELERGGQIYFVHNRVETIYEIAAKIQELVPHARITVGHGQMGEAELEKVMLAFMNHEYDVLVATSIIENGLDIPLANTILINRADRHGLSELYQLRGRVGRSNRRAYAYLMIPPEQELTEIARRRLAALKEFSDLGAGFKIAALDLELRGAGNMLGGEQSGHIEAVGFELYTTMLEEAVNKMKGQETVERPVTQLSLGIPLRIDDSYIPEENQRLRMYKHIAGAQDERAIAGIRAELVDRYGALPTGVRHLLDAAELRIACEHMGVAQVDRKRDQIHLKFTEKASIDPGILMKLVSKNAKRGAQFTPQGVLRFPLSGTDPESIFTELRVLLDDLATQPAAARQGAS
ncbi:MULTISPECIES: transcription-repair coupling factor [Acidobacterium]|uniref:Transcription-repair-coupling factor n=1 Tax=Acidobacterium capsulatum (strain ATCC 51196 / DSM 11244 / BCRC 80197 / JCM 7670 / NBRC 15755 / NCIMB 13165 / 161) TaxID=240015 RepID=C1F915_ACIC5|nr:MULTISPECIES: transcription-repair coupling factor [Acidobacterium]ACO34679.1 transcription-repair coupling factor [Acidobacterium capsulatum ATCC 51196]HCT62138.1 transcription-repair coupling factor [Acidobacterium sp.]